MQKKFQKQRPVTSKQIYKVNAPETRQVIVSGCTDKEYTIEEGGSMEFSKFGKVWALSANGRLVNAHHIKECEVVRTE